MRKLLLIPSQAGYAAQRGMETKTNDLDGGPSRRRRDFIGAVARVQVGWNLPPLQFQVLEAFYKSVSLHGLMPFEVDLVLDSWMPVTYVATFVPGTYRLGGVRGMETSISAELEVKPLAPDPEYDLALVDLYEEYGDDLVDFINLFAHVVNVQMPAAIGP